MADLDRPITTTEVYFFKTVGFGKGEYLIINDQS